MQLPYFQTAIKELSLLQTKWKSILDPVLATPSVQNLILPNVKLDTGSNVINHMLGRKLTGWQIVRQRSLASIYDNQDANQKPELTLLLVSDSPVLIDIEVF